MFKGHSRSHVFSSDSRSLAPKIAGMTLPRTTARVWFDPVVEEGKFLPEGPRALGDTIVWVNIQTAADGATGQLYEADFADPNSVILHELPGRPGFALPTDQPGKWLLGIDHVIGMYDTAIGLWTPLAMLPNPDPRVIINDGEVAPDESTVVFGTKDTRFEEPIAHLYLFTPADNRLTVLLGGQTCSNGKVFADLGRTLFDIDTPRKVVTRYRFDAAERTLSENGIAIDLRDRADFPDGMCDCGDGTVIIAFYNPAFAEAGLAVRYDLATGAALEEWATPGSPRVTCPCLVQRPDGVKLLVTTATEGMPAEMRMRCPDAGKLFVAETPIESIPTQALVRLRASR